MQLYDKIGYEIGCCSLYLEIIFLWLPFINLSGDKKTTKSPLRVQQNAQAIAGTQMSISVVEHAIYWTTSIQICIVYFTPPQPITRIIPVIIEFVSYPEPHDKYFPNQSLSTSVFFFLQISRR